MDPKQALIDADQAISDERWADAIMALNGYAQWRFTGGFEPRHMDSIRCETHGDKVFDALMFLLVARLPRACEECGSLDDVQDYYAGTTIEDGEWLCDECRQDKAERSAERQIEDFYGGSSPTLAEQQEQARRLK
jgi:hypothetical protein